MFHVKAEKKGFCRKMALFLVLAMFASGYHAYAQQFEEPVPRQFSDEELRERYLENIRERHESYEIMRTWENERMQQYQERVEARQHRLNEMLERSEELAERADERLAKARTISDLYAEAERMRHVNLSFIMLMVLVMIVALFLAFREMRKKKSRQV